MTQKTGIISRLTAALWILVFTTGCTDSILIKKADLSGLEQRLLLIEQTLKNQSAKTESIVELQNKQQNEFVKTAQQNELCLTRLKDQIEQTHNFLKKRLISIEKTTKNHLNKDDLKISQNLNDQKNTLKISDPHKLLIGKIEKVRLTPPDRIFHARIDTGATTSSLDAQDIEIFERDGDSWVKFKIKDPVKDTFYDVEKPLVRKAKIKQASTDEANIRPVIELQFQLGDIKRIEEFTLEDRSHLDFQLLIGRNILRDLMVVDVAQEFIVPIPEEEENGNHNK